MLLRCQDVFHNFCMKDETEKMYQDLKKVTELLS